METIQLYTPPNARTLDIAVEQQIRLGIQGFPHTGKTTAALTFPNPVVIDMDRGLGGHIGRKEIIQVPFYDPAFCRTINPAHNLTTTKDDLILWIDKEGRKLTENQTLILDGNTGLQNAYHRWYKANMGRFLTKSGTVNDFAEWTVKREYFGEIMEMFKTLRCHVVYICHEVDQKDKNGVQGPSYSGKIRPLLTGSFGDELGSHFTDWFRQHSKSKVNLNTVTDAELAKWRMTKAELAEWMKQFDTTIYYWQTTSDDIFDGGSKSMVNQPSFVPATYESFLKYRRK